MILRVLFIFTLCLMSFYDTANARPRKTPPTSSTQNFVAGVASESNLAQLKTIFDTSAKEIADVESLMAQMKFSEAMTKAKQIVDRVSVIRPKTTVVERIPHEGEFYVYNLRMKFEDLQFNQQQQIAATVGAFKGGYFMDLLNLFKRAKLLYSVAKYRLLQDQLLQRDIDSLRESLIDTHNIALYIQHAGLVEPMMIFDIDVANPDQQDLFNRELVVFLMTVKSKDDEPWSESEIDRKLIEDRKNKLEAHWKDLKAPRHPSEIAIENSSQYAVCGKESGCDRFSPRYDKERYGQCYAACYKTTLGFYQQLYDNYQSQSSK